MSKILKIGWIGGGKMAQAMAKGIVSAGQQKFHISDVNLIVENSKHFYVINLSEPSFYCLLFPFD